MTLLNSLFYVLALAIELQLSLAVVRLVKVAYLDGTPKYDVYYLLLAIIGMLVANSCYVTSINWHTLPKELSFLLRGHAQITYNFFQLFAIVFYGLYLVRNLTFKNNLVQKTLMISLELAYIGYLIFMPTMLDGNVWLTSSVVTNVFDLTFGMGQLSGLSKINNWLTAMLAVISVIFLALFVYASSKMTRSDKHARTFHDFMLFLLYCLTAFMLNVMTTSSGEYGVLFISLVVILSYRVMFFRCIYRTLTPEKLTEEARL